MPVGLRKIKLSDKKYFAKWWRDKDLIKLTSGNFNNISDKQIDTYFQKMLKNKNSHDYIIVLNKNIIIGHIALAKRKGDWFETQIVIGEKKYWGKGYGTKAIKQLINRAKTKKISKIYLEVRPNNLRAINSYKKCGFKAAKLTNYPKNKFLQQTLRMELK